MRTAKYNNYAILRILLFIILIVLAVFAYKYFVKAPCEHNIGSWVTVNPTCTEDGYRYKECSKCGEQFSSEVLEATGHKNNKVVTVKEATCSKEGIESVSCSVCDAHYQFNAIPTVSHTPGETVVKNEKHTLAEGASYEEYVYCTECDEQISMKKVDVEHTVETTVETTNPTCVEKGTVVTTIYCKECDKTLSTESKDIAPLGHSFAWTLSFKNEEFVLNGECAVTECGHEYDPKIDTNYTYDVVKDENASVVPTCGGGYDVFVATIYNDGVKVAETSTKVYLPADPESEHALYVRLKDANGNWVVKNPAAYADYKLNKDGFVVDENGELINFLQYALEDEQGIYFNASTLGFIKISDSEWDQNGFALGAFKCSADVLEDLEHWVTVRIYNDLA